FVEVYLAKEGHSNPVGINLLTKVQMPNLASLYGAMLAGVDYVLMGAGIPREIPGVLDAFSEHRPASLKLDVDDMPPGESEYITLDPSDYWEKLPPSLRGPRFLPITSANSLAPSLARKSTDALTASWWKVRPRADTTPRRAEPCSWTRADSPSTATAMRWTWTSWPNSGFPSGWRVAPVHPRECEMRSRQALPVFRWERSSPTATSPASRPRSSVARWRVCCAARWRSTRILSRLPRATRSRW